MAFPVIPLARIAVRRVKDDKSFGRTDHLIVEGLPIRAVAPSAQGYGEPQYALFGAIRSEEYGDA